MLMVTVIRNGKLESVVQEEEGWEMDLIIRYDPEADVLVVKLREGAVADEELLDNDAIVGYDREGRVVYVEVLDASKKGLISALAELAKASAVEHPPPRRRNKTPQNYLARSGPEGISPSVRV
jgi:uncharacterized protein YuzE